MTSKGLYVLQCVAVAQWGGEISSLSWEPCEGAELVVALFEVGADLVAACTPLAQPTAPSQLHQIWQLASICPAAC